MITKRNSQQTNDRGKQRNGNGQRKVQGANDKVKIPVKTERHNRRGVDRGLEIQYGRCDKDSPERTSVLNAEKHTQGELWESKEEKGRDV